MLNFSRHWVLLLGALLAARPLAAAEVIPIAVPVRTNAVDFAHEIQPIFRHSCLACHHRAQAEADLVLETPADIRKGGESGPAVVPGRSGDSLLLAMASHAQKPFMPPRNNKAGALPLTPDQLGLIKVWIDQGATGTVDVAAQAVHWQAMPPDWTPILAIAVAPDGQFAACGRANQVFLDHLPTVRAVARLADPALEKEFGLRGIADRDLIQSLAFSPDGTLIAAGGYRAVRLWHRPAPVFEPRTPVSAGFPTNPFVATADDWTVVAQGNSARLELVSTQKLVAELKGERHATEALSELELQQAFLKDEIGRRRAALDQATKQRNDQTNAVAKAVTALEKTAKTLTEKQEATKKASEARAAVLAALTEASNVVAKATADRVAADQALTNAVAATKSAREKATNAVAAPTKTPAVPTPASDPAADAAAAKKAIEQLIADGLAREKEATNAKTAAEKIVTEATRKRDEAEKRLKDAQKSADDSANALKIAQSVHEGTDHALTLTRAELKRLEEALPVAKRAVEATEQSARQTETNRIAADKLSKDAERPVRAVALSTNLGLVATGDDAGLVHLWSVANGLPVETLRGLTGAVEAIAFRDHRVIARSTNGAGAAWTLPVNWPLERVLGTGDEHSPLLDRVLCVRFSPDGSLLATGGGVPSRNGELKLWRVSDGALIREITNAHSDTVYALDFSPDGQWLASGGADRFVRVWKVETGRLAKAFEGHTHHVLGVGWRRDGRVLASAGADRVVKIWDFETGSQRKTTEAAAKEVTGLQFLGIGSELLVSRGDNIVRRLKDDGTGTRDFSGPTQYMTCVAATPDGRLIVAAGHDSVMRVWNAKGEPWTEFTPARDQAALLANEPTTAPSK